MRAWLKVISRCLKATNCRFNNYRDAVLNREENRMTSIGFIGLGNMGGPMLANLVKAGHDVKAFDLVPEAMARAAKAGATKAEDAAAASRDVEVVITMLPAGKHVRSVYTESVFDSVAAGTLLIDCSTIDVATARAVGAIAAERGFEMLDAPVSGGTGGAEAGTLTFMVGGPDDAFVRGKPLLEIMGQNIVHTGGSGNGQVAKICNNMILGATMVAVSEGFVMADKLGLDKQKLYDICSTSSSSCWALNTYCPVPGPAPASPANRDYEAGFTAAMMLKDLRLAQGASQDANTATPMGAAAEAMFSLFCNSNDENLDFSAIINMIRGN
jgi:3-hydroxyisobutyrate dehydrogenase